MGSQAEGINSSASFNCSEIMHNRWFQKGTAVTLIAIGVISALVGMFAMLAVTGNLPHFLFFMQGLNVLGHGGAIAFMAGGTAMAGVTTLIWIALACCKQKQITSPNNSYINPSSFEIKTTSGGNQYIPGSYADLLEVDSSRETINLEPCGHIASGETNSLASWGVWGKDTTYDVEDGAKPGNVDFSYADPELGFGFVVDGTGHNNSLMYPELKSILESFIDCTEQTLEDKEFQTLEEAQTCIYQIFAQLAILIRENKAIIHPNFFDVSENQRGEYATFYQLSNTTYNPAISLSFIVECDGTKYLITGQMGDTFLVVYHAQDGTYEYLPNMRNDSPTALQGIGAYTGSNMSNIAVPELVVQSLDQGDKVFGFSDGVGEFLTQAELTKLLKENTDPGELLEEVKNKIGEIAQSNPQEDQKYRSDPELRPANADPSMTRKAVKYCRQNSSECYDDISFFMLEV